MRAHLAPLLTLLLVVPAPARAGGEDDGAGAGPGRAQFLEAARATERVDRAGRLDAGPWLAAPPFEGFTQIFPSEGDPPSERTVVRVLYDDAALYVAVTCLDRAAAEIVRPLGRRDSPPSSDNVQLIVDSSHDHRTAQAFTLTAAGVQADGLYYDDDRYTAEWDGVWEGHVTERPDGWSALFVLPLSLFHVSSTPVQTWGFGVRREIGRSHEIDASVLVPRRARGVVSRLGHLTGLAGLRPRGDVELAPYLASRLTARPQHADDGRPYPRLVDPSADLGLDLRARLGSRFTLVGTLNPDFGQVESDQVILNLTTFEPFRPEKRSFFNEGLELFQPVGTGNENVPQQLFYSRRIGLDTPILAAAKVTGDAGSAVRVGFLDAFVTATDLTLGTAQDRPDRGFSYGLAQPLHAGLADAAPLQSPLAQNFLAGVARWQPAGSATFGAMVTSAVPLGPRCTAAEAALELAPTASRPDGPFRPRRCTVPSGNAAALDWNVRTRDSEWGAYGQVAGSQVLRGPPARLLPDGVALHDGDLGLGTYLTAGRLGGEPWRFDLHYEYESPRLELNPSGFQRTQNEQVVRATLRYVRPSGGGPLHRYELLVSGRTHFTTDGRGLNRFNTVGVGGSALLKKPWLGLGCEAWYQDPANDVRELNGTGVPLLRPPWWQLGCSLETDPAQAVAGTLAAGAGRNLAWAPLAATWFGGFEANLAVRPHPRVETRLGVAQDVNRFPLRYADDDGAGSFTLGELLAPTLSFTLRQLVVLAPRLTLQLYGQLFSAYERYGPLWSASSTGPAIGPRSLVPLALPPGVSYDTHQTVLAVNVVLRWEYRPGSTLFLVYDRAQREAQDDRPGVAHPATLGPRSLGPGPAVDVVLVKLSYWLGL